MTILNHTLGFPRVGLRRELKKAQESYWAGNSTREELLQEFARNFGKFPGLRAFWF